MKKQPEALSFEQIGDLTEHQRATLGRFVEILASNRGSATPAEEFIIGLVRTHRANGIPLTPDNVQDDIAEFRENFELTLETTRRFTRLYPGLVLGDECGCWGDQYRTLKSIALELDEGDWANQADSRIETAREAIRKYPDLILSDQSFEEIRKSMSDQGPVRNCSCGTGSRGACIVHSQARS